MFGVNNVSEETERCQSSPLEESCCWYDYFKDVGTQVEENEIIKECKMLEERLVSENSAPVSQICATGVTETPAAGNCGQVFHAARLNTEPRLIFMLPSMRSAFDEPRNFTLSSLGAVNKKNQISTSAFSATLACCSSLPPVLSTSMTSPRVTSQRVTSPFVMPDPVATPTVLLTSTIASVPLSSPRITTATLSFQPVTSFTMTTITSARATSSMTSSTSESVTSLITSESASLALLTTETLESSILSPKLYGIKETPRKCRSPSPRLSPKQSSTSNRTPSPRRRDVKSPENIGTPSPTRLEARDQSHEQTRDANRRAESKSPTNAPERENTPGTSASAKFSLKQNTSGACTMEDESIPLKSLPVKNSPSDKSTKERISSKQCIPESSTLVMPLNPPKHTEIDVPLSTCEDNGTGTTFPKVINASSGSLESESLETVKSGSSSLEMTASSSSAGSWENEQSYHILAVKKRRRTGAKPSGRGKRRKSKMTIDKTDDNKELGNKN